MQQRRKPLRRSGFTVIELLVVIGIIMLLGGIAFVAFRGMQQSSMNKRTETILQNAAGMLAEYDTATGLRRQPTGMWKGGSTPQSHKTVDGVFDIWRDADPDTDGEQRLVTMRSVDADDAGNNDRDSAAVRNAAVVLSLIAKTPAGRNMMSQMPANATMMLKDATSGAEIGPVLLDAWGNPIIFVPAAGLTVAVGDPPEVHVVTSGKSYPVAQLPLGTVAPNARPFFASAGPDGALSVRPGPDGQYGTADDQAGADDNLYSFQN